ncbi:MAG TPA: DUF2182 domain-containing protein [Anaerolineales bacterium]|nr:DUF2182 domain-containing protein [Anaerolineales bacterium]
MWIKTNTRRPLTMTLIALSVLAWLALWLWGQSPYSRFLSHHSLDVVSEDSSLISVFILGWAVMTVAMMLPTSLPLIALFHTMTRGRRDGVWLVALLVAGYVGVWLAFGGTVYLGDWVLHQLVEQSRWLTDRAWMISGLVLIAAGVYQFTPLKYHCLDKCRSPMTFIAERWHGQKAVREALLLGAHHGLFCLGCCWSLMLLMFAIGAGSLGWMLVLGAVMAVEKNMPWGRRISKPLGVALVVWGAVYFLLTAVTLRVVH